MPRSGKPDPIARRGKAARLHLLAWSMWIVLAATICFVSQQQGFRRTVVHSYRAASLAWVVSQPVYELNSIHGFLYLPSAAAVTVPFLALPPSAHELAFRAALIALLAWGTCRLARCVTNVTGHEAFLGMTVLVIPTAIGSAMAGQMNLALAAISALAAADVIEERWNSAAIWLGLGFALKPQMAVFLLLAGAIFPALRLRATLALIAALILPFLLQSPPYVIEQYRLCWEKLRLSGNPTAVNIHFNDLFGLLASVGLDLGTGAQWLIRTIAIPLTVLCTWHAARYGDTARKAFVTLAWAAVYLMLFNPRSEGGSYVIIAMPLAVFAVCAAAPRCNPVQLTLLILIDIGWTASFPISQALHIFARHFIGTHATHGWHYWFSPLLVLLFLGYLVYLDKKTPDRGELSRVATA
jgi:alpha-1,2-mannosyltransferase